MIINFGSGSILVASCGAHHPPHNLIWGQRRKYDAEKEQIQIPYHGPKQRRMGWELSPEPHQKSFSGKEETSCLSLGRT